MSERRGVDRFAILMAVVYAFFAGVFLVDAFHGRQLPAAPKLDLDPRVEKAGRAAEAAFHQVMAEPAAEA